MDHFGTSLATAESAQPLLQRLGLRDSPRGWQNLRHLEATLGAERMLNLTGQLARHLPHTPEPDMALNGLERFLSTPKGREQWPNLAEARTGTLETLLQLFSASQFFSDLLFANPDYLEMLGVPLRESPTKDELQNHLQSEVDAAFEDSAVLRAFRRFRHRQLLRIGVNDIIRNRPLEEITRDLSNVADAAVAVAYATALRQISRRFGQPRQADGDPANAVILAFGKLGGKELNYSSDIDLMVVYDQEGVTQGKPSISNDEFFGRVTTEVVRLLSAHPQAFRVDLRLRPEGARGPLARSLASTLSYYDTLGRTWERQALIKVRPIAGDLELGMAFWWAIEPFVYRRYLSFAEINEIKALKRRIEHRTTKAGEDAVEVKTGRGGIRDVEFVIQFLQLLNGGDSPAVRQRNTLQAIHSLEQAGCLTYQECQIFEDAYRFLRKVEHRLQLLFDLQTHRLPERLEELRHLALRMGYRDDSGASAAAGTSPAAAQRTDALSQFLNDYREKTDANRRILNHLLHETFKDSDGQAEPESDLILAPDPDAETLRQVLGRYRFQDVQAAYANLMQLAQESVPFLSPRRCRHFLASIAPNLLRVLAETPDPDMALVNLEQVTASLGAKGVLWELFSFSPPSLKLYVDLCAWSQFLSEILITNPGMIDEVLDSLVLNQPRNVGQLRSELLQLCRGAEDTSVILHSFHDKELLRIGVNDILGKDTLQTTLAALSDLAETILAQIATLSYPLLTKRFGAPLIAEGRESRFVLLGLGKLGGREMSYNSDLDLILVYEGDGNTGGGDRGEATTNIHFFSELAQRIIKTTSELGPHGRLYQVDMRLRPTGRSGSLVISLAEFRRYYALHPLPHSSEESRVRGEGAQLWERQALTRGRVVFGDAEFGQEVMAAVAEAAYGLTWRPEYADEIVQMRKRLEASRSERNLKRGFGGLVDIEFLVQLFQIKYGRRLPEICSPNTCQALAALHAHGLLQDGTFEELSANYDFLRRIESRLRIVYNISQDELPSQVQDIEKLARRLDYEAGDGVNAAELFLRDMDRRTARTRELFLALVDQERRSG
jgi:glutamate-ammonia-ligase adenylyltransferase